MKVPNSGKILVLRSDRLGDLVMSTGYLSILAEALPGAVIDLWLSPDMEPLRQLLHPGINVKVLPFDRHLTTGKDAAAAWIRDMTAERYSSLIIPQYTLGIPEHLALSYLPVESRQGFVNPEILFLNEWLELEHGKPLRSVPEFLQGPAVDPWTSDVDKLSELAKWQELPATDCRPHVRIPGADLTAKSGGQGMLLWPNAAKEEFRWPEARFAELIGTMGVKGPVIVGAARGEEAEAQDLAHRLEAVGVKTELSLRERDELSQTAQWLSVFEAVITNDTGIGHLAAAVGCPVVSLSGAQHEGRFAVRGRSALTIYADAPCRRCSGRCIFDENPRPCIAGISPQSVATAMSLWGRGEEVRRVAVPFFTDPPSVYRSVHANRLRMETERTKDLFEATRTISNWERTCQEAEAQRDNWERTCREAETQRDQYLHSLDAFYALFPWMRGEAVGDALQKIPRISIITPSYNQGEYLEETIRSVLEQHYINFEHIVVDAGSNDRTIEVLNRYPHVRWISEKDKGQAHAINKGIMMSTGDIVAYLNSDDLYRPGAFQAAAEVFAKEPETMIVVGNCDTIDEHSGTTGFLKAQYNGFEGLLRYWGWDKWFCIPQQSVFWRRSLLSEVGLFDIRYHMVMDYDMWLRAAYRYPFRVIDRTLAAFRFSDNTKTVSRTYQMFLEEFTASKAQWHKLSAVKRLPVILSAHRYVGRKIHGVAEHFAFEGRERRLSLKLLMTSVLKWPVLTLDPRTWFTAMQILTMNTRTLNNVRSMHRSYLDVIWRIKKQIKSMLGRGG